MGDPKRLLELNQDCESPDVLLQNLLGAAQADSAPTAARQRMLRSIEGAFHATTAAPEAPSAARRSANTPEPRRSQRMAGSGSHSPEALAHSPGSGRA